MNNTRDLIDSYEFDIKKLKDELEELLSELEELLSELEELLSNEAINERAKKLSKMYFNESYIKISDVLDMTFQEFVNRFGNG